MTTAIRTLAGLILVLAGVFLVLAANGTIADTYTGVGLFLALVGIAAASIATLADPRERH